VIKLRDYQVLALRHLRQRIQQGDRRLYVTLPTGTGKGVLIAACATRRVQQGQQLVLIHRQEIALQLARTLAQEGLDVGLLMQGQRQLDRSVVVATLPSLEAMLPAVIEAHNSPISTVLIDEAHHAVEGSAYERILAALEAQQQIVAIGFTATPYRSDTKSMFSVLPTCAFAREIPEMVRDGWLAPLTWDPVPIALDLATLPASLQDGESDYAEEALTSALSHESLTDAIVRHALPRLEQRPTLVFAITVDHARQFAEVFGKSGVEAAVVSGRTSLTERKRILDAWLTGAIQVVCNCSLLTEGFDFPALAALLIARPTRSPSLYMQMLGRGMRLSPGKHDCLVIDVLGNRPDLSHQVVLPHIMGVNTPEGEDLLTGKRAPTPVPSPDLLRKIMGANVETGLSILDPIGESPYRWSAYRGGYFTMVNSEIAAIIERDPTGSGLYHSRLYIMPRGKPSIHQWIERNDLPLRQQVALVHEATGGLYRKALGGKDAPWLAEPASEKQLAALQLLHKGLAKEAQEKGWTKGAATEAISYRVLSRTLKHPPSTRDASSQ
jgi:superfamily II DNA or RNA helicase